MVPKGVSCEKTSAIKQCEQPFEIRELLWEKIILIFRISKKLKRVCSVIIFWNWFHWNIFSTVPETPYNIFVSGITADSMLLKWSVASHQPGNTTWIVTMYKVMGGTTQYIREEEMRSGMFFIINQWFLRAADIIVNHYTI